MHVYLLAMAIAMAPLSVANAGTPTTTEQSYRQAREVLDAAVQAAGGADALRAVKDVSRVGRGTVFNQGQSLQPDAPYTQRGVDVSGVSDFGRKWSATETSTTTAGNVATASARSSRATRASRSTGSPPCSRPPRPRA